MLKTIKNGSGEFEQMNIGQVRENWHVKIARQAGTSAKGKTNLFCLCRVLNCHQ